MTNSGATFMDYVHGFFLVFLFICALGACIDRYRIFGVRAPRFLVGKLQDRIKIVRDQFDQQLEAALVEAEKHHLSEKLRQALLSAHFINHSHDFVPWIKPVEWTNDFEVKLLAGVNSLKAALEYQKTPAFLLEASEALRAKLASQPADLDKRMQDIERHYQQELVRLGEQKTARVAKALEHEATVGLELQSEIAAIELQIQAITSGITINTGSFEEGTQA